MRYGATTGLAVAAAIPGTLVHRIGPAGAGGQVRFGHPSGTFRAGTEAREEDGRWVVSNAMMNRSTRCLMEGRFWVPVD